MCSWQLIKKIYNVFHKGILLEVAPMSYFYSDRTGHSFLLRLKGFIKTSLQVIQWFSFFFFTNSKLHFLNLALVLSHSCSKWMLLTIQDKNHCPVPCSPWRADIITVRQFIWITFWTHFTAIQWNGLPSTIKQYAYTPRRPKAI